MSKAFPKPIRWLVFLSLLALGVSVAAQVKVENTGGGGSGSGGAYTFDDGADIATLANSTTAQTVRNYATFTDSSNYERLAFNYSADVLGSATTGFELSAETAGTGTDDIALHLQPSGAGFLILGNPGVTQSNILVTHPNTSNRFVVFTRLASTTGNTNVTIASSGAGLSWSYGGMAAITTVDNNADAYYLTWDGPTDPATAPTSYFYKADSTNSNEELTFGVPMAPQTVLQANLPSSANGTMVFCSDCNPDSTCTGSGSGAFAFRIGGAWACELN